MTISCSPGGGIGREDGGLEEPDNVAQYEVHFLDDGANNITALYGGGASGRPPPHNGL